MAHLLGTHIRTYKTFHLCCGSGNGAKGMNKGKARVSNLQARFRCIGGVDVDPLAIEDFTRETGTRGTVLDLFSYDQYVAWHGHEPPAAWREATAADLRAAAGGEYPDIIFISAPCKGFTALLSQGKSDSPKYQALNGLALRAEWLAHEAFKDDPPAFFISENVPMIASRGAHLMAQSDALFRQYGYAVHATPHDCGEIGGLGQHRKRLLKVARHTKKVPPYLYQPRKQRVRGCGEILDKLPMPGDACAGPMHRMPSLQWKTWVRLALVEAGGDWRSLNRLRVENGMLADYGIVPEKPYRDGTLGVLDWNQPAGTITGKAEATTGRFSVADPRTEGRREMLGVRRFDQASRTVTGNGRPATGAFNVADPRIDGHPKSVQLGVRSWEKPAPTVTGNMAAGAGQNAVGDPRAASEPSTHKNVFRVVAWNQAAGTVTSGHGPSSGGQSVADPRPHYPDSTHANIFSVASYDGAAKTVTGASHVTGGAQAVADPRCNWNSGSHQNKLAVTPYDKPARTITATGGHGVTSGVQSVADPRPDYLRNGRDSFVNGGMYGVKAWAQPSDTIAAAAQHDNGRWSVADPRIDNLPALDDRLVAIIIALDGTWHRPFTTLELAALQTFFDPEEWFEKIDGVWQCRMEQPYTLAGTSDKVWREHIGNAVPADAAAAIASVMGECLLLAESGQTFMLSNDPIWVSPLHWGLSLPDMLASETFN